MGVMAGAWLGDSCGVVGSSMVELREDGEGASSVGRIVRIGKDEGTAAAGGPEGSNVGSGVGIVLGIVRPRLSGSALGEPIGESDGSAVEVLVCNTVRVDAGGVVEDWEVPTEVDAIVVDVVGWSVGCKLPSDGVGSGADKLVDVVVGGGAGTAPDPSGEGGDDKTG
mmetsp:Transcript_11205/g.35568  ORF Transcript_11205/g.35568 Transcript_11205/m.35568 type:complete len:167 (+) Transcript_11205:6352-6852(+)